MNIRLMKLFVNIIVPIISIAMAFAFLETSNLIFRKREPIDLSKRIEIVSENLRNTSTELNSIQRELEQRIEFVEKLNEEAKNAEEMINLTKEQVDAIRAALNTELNKNNAQNFWTTFATSFLFLILGSAITFITPKLRDKIKSRKQKKQVKEKMPDMVEGE